MNTAISTSAKIQSFTDLNAWKEGHKLVIMIYELASSLPLEEKFRLANQLRSAAASVTSNIAEGFRKKTRKEKQQFFRTSIASLTEIENQLYIARDVKYLPVSSFEVPLAQVEIVGRLLNGLLRSAMNKP